MQIDSYVNRKMPNAILTNSKINDIERGSKIIELFCFNRFFCRF